MELEAFKKNSNWQLKMVGFEQTQEKSIILK